MKKLFFFISMLIMSQIALADTIANWKVYYNAHEIVRLNEHHKDYQLKIGKQLIRKNDILTVNYFNDTPCTECNSYLFVLSGAKLVAKTKGKGTYASKKIDLYKLFKLSQDTFKVYHYESRPNEKQAPRLLFSIIIEEDSVFINEAFLKIENDLLKSSFKTLVDSKITYPFGYKCGFAPEKPRGRVAIEILRKSSRFDLVKLVLNGENQTGKLYAIEELLNSEINYKNLLSSFDKFLIKRIIQKDIPIETCGGCFYRETTTLELSKEKYFKELLEKNEIY